jgi:hypothetical protein
LPQAVRRAERGKTDGDLVVELREHVEAMRQRLSRHVEEVSARQYVEAARFLHDLGDGVRILESPRAMESIRPAYPTGEMMLAELVAYLDDKGLAFAPAMPADEEAYRTVYRALVEVDLAARDNMVSRR